MAPFSRGSVHSKRFGVAGTCKKCSRERSKQQQEEIKLSPELLEKEKIRSRDKLLRCRYGLSLDVYNQVLKSQDNVCKICQNLPKIGRFLVVDHSHKTGEIRGLLCDGCNIKIAILEDENLLNRALKYLKRDKS